MSMTKPVHQVRLGTVKAAVWANPTDDGRVRYSVTVQRIYRDNEEWKHTMSFRRNDLLVLDMAHSWICQHPNERAGAT